MSRPKEFDPDSALEAAMQAFWEHGYQGTSLVELTRCMGVQKASLYGTFGDKRALFVAALERYQDQGLERLRAALDGGGTLRERLGRVLGHEGEPECTGSKPPGGCLWISSLLEVAPRDAEVAELQRVHQKRVEDLLFRSLQAGARAGELPARRATRERARALYAAWLGVSLLRTLGSSSTVSADAARTLLADALAAEADPSRTSRARKE